MQKNQSIHRAFTILQAIAASSTGARVNAIAAHVRLPKSTVSRMLATLEELKLVERAPDGDEFIIGSGITALASGVPYARNLSSIARPHMLELSERTGEAVALCLADGDEMRVLDLVQTRHRVQVEDITGEAFPLHATSPGKIFLAFRSDKSIRDYLRRPLARYTPNTITSPDALKKQLAEIRAQGLAWVIEELDHIAGVSAPIRDETGQVVAALNLYGPSFRFPPGGQQDEMSRLVLEASENISKRLAMPARLSDQQRAPARRRKPVADGQK